MTEHDSPNPPHVYGRHADTLAQIFRHPVSHNIEWKKVVALLEQVGTVIQEHDGRYKIHVGDETEVFNRPHGKDLTEQQVVDLRRMLNSIGVAPESGPKRDHGDSRRGAP